MMMMMMMMMMITPTFFNIDFCRALMKHDFCRSPRLLEAQRRRIVGPVGQRHVESPSNGHNAFSNMGNGAKGKGQTKWSREGKSCNVSGNFESTGSRVLRDLDIRQGLVCIWGQSSTNQHFPLGCRALKGIRFMLHCLWII